MFHIPLRITRKEWEMECPLFLNQVAQEYKHPLFTLSGWVEFDEKWDYCPVMHVTYLGGTKRGKTFGPHRDGNLTFQQVLDFLIEKGYVQLIDEECIRR